MDKIHVGDFHIGPAERQAVLDVLDSGRLSEGPKVRQFEQEWAKYIGVRHGIATSSGAGALICALSALKYHRNIPDGAKVLTTPLTYIATSTALNAVGLQPVYVDIEPETFVITPEAIEAHLAGVPDIENYVAILPVDLMGYSVRIDEIIEIGKKYGLDVIEDASQAHGTKYKGKRAGSTALMSTFSFYIAHNIQAGEMGAVVTDDPELKRLVKKIKAQGRACDCPVCTRDTSVCPKMKDDSDEEYFDPRFSHDLIGYNFKTMEFQAALAAEQLKKVDEIIAKRQHNVFYLNRGLEKHGDILQLPVYSEDISYLAYPIVIKNKALSRREIQKGLESRGIETRPLFGCIPTQQPAYAYLKDQYEGRLENADYIGRNAFYIGCHQYLTEADLDQVIAAFDHVLAGGK